MAAISQNRWPVHGNQLQLHVLPWVTGRVVGGDVWTVLDYLCRRYNAEVERIDRSSSWGWAYRPIRGALTGLSNHASATAVDLNADKHPLGVRGTFTPQQKAAVRRILADIGTGILRWGEDYIKRVDGMHFELNVGPGDPRLAAAAKRIRNGQASGGNPGLPTTGDGPTATKPTTPTTPTGGLTVSDVEKILATLNSDKTGLPYLSSQIKATNQSVYDKTKALGEQNRAIANGSFGRDAINARNADTAAIVQKVITAALGQVPGVDMGKVAATVKAATTQALAERDAVDADAVVARIVEKLEA